MKKLILVLFCFGLVGCQPPPPPAPVPKADTKQEDKDKYAASPESIPPPVPKSAKDPTGEPVTSPIPSGTQPPPEVGYFGYEPPSKDELEKEQKALGVKPLYEEAPQLFREERKQDRGDADEDHSSTDEPVLLYRFCEQAWPGIKIGSQGIGDCVSWGWARGANILRAKMYVQNKEPRGPPPLFAATEAIYGGSRCEARGRSYAGFSDGSYGAAAAKFVRDWGVVYRQPFPDFGFDLTTYDKNRAKQWGAYGCGGKDDAGKLDDVAKKHPIRRVALVRSFAEAAVAIKNGYPVPVCSGQGFSSTRDSEGFCKASGSWAHCMNFEGVRFDRPGLLCMNSWGPNWVKGPKWPDETRGPRGPPQPDGSFWVDSKTVDRMLAGNDSYAISELDGFKNDRLRNDEGW